MIISIANQKGGVGKTTTTMNLGAALAKEGKRVLLVDSDPQGNLTSYLGVRLQDENWSAAGTLDEVYLSKRPFDAAKARGMTLRTAAGVDLIPADGNLSGVEYYLFSRPERESVLRRFLALLADDYDFILIDTPPSLNLLTLNALVASDRVLVPVQPEFFSLEGIVKIRETLDRVRESWNPGLSIIGILPTQVAARRRLTREVIEALQGEMGDTLFSASIAENAAVSESSGQGKSVLDYARSSKGALDYAAAAKELLERAAR